MDKFHLLYHKMKRSLFVEIIILNWNGRDDTLNCLRSIEKLSYPNYHVTVVDNGSSDHSVRAIQAVYRDMPWITIIETGRNLGYAGGNNVGMRAALQKNVDYCWILNNDTVVESESLTRLVQTATGNPQAGILGPKVLCYPDTKFIYSKGEYFNLWFSRRTIQVGEMDRNQGILPRDVDYIVGCAMLISRDFIERVGMLDETYFLFYEEIDWCFRGRQAGFHILYDPRSVIYHRGGAITGGDFSSTSAYFRTRNWIYFMRKHASYYHWITFVPIFVFVFARRFVVAMTCLDFKIIVAMCRGVAWHFKRQKVSTLR